MTKKNISEATPKAAGKRRTAAVICPGRGTYTKTELGYLARTANPAAQALVAHLDRRLLDAGRPTVSELDGAKTFSPRLHTPGENAAPLIYACSMADRLAIDPETVEIVAVTGHSMGWYTALAAAGALAEDAAFDVVHTMGSMMTGGVIGGQLIYPTVDPVTWRHDPERRALVERALAEVNLIPGCEAYVSIRFGGYAIIGGNDKALAVLMKSLPPADDGKYPFQLVNHAAFHTPLLEDVSVRAFAALPASLFRRPELPLVDGRGVIWQPWGTDPAALRDYTLGHQVTRLYDFSRAVEVTLKEFAPDLLILLGPGATSGGAIGQILVAQAWDGITDKAAFGERQTRAPVLVAMGRDDQRGLATGAAGRS